jgi:2-dehydropantoate 2-reductase
MKVLMFGRGVINTLYGWTFEKAGHQVDFYVRPGRAEYFGSVVSLDICDVRKDLKGTVQTEQWQTNLREDLPLDHDYDIIIASVQFFRCRKSSTFCKAALRMPPLFYSVNFGMTRRRSQNLCPKTALSWAFRWLGERSRATRNWSVLCLNRFCLALLAGSKKTWRSNIYFVPPALSLRGKKI